MIQLHFIKRLMLLIAVGIVYVYAYTKMAKRASKELVPERHRIIRVIGGIFAVLSVFFAVLSIFYFTKITFPEHSIEPSISSNSIIRPDDRIMFWGYPTPVQHQCISMFLAVFEFLALSAYCFMFKSSHSKWYTKIGKIVFCILFYIFYVSATDFHYFDLYEWFVPALFGLMAIIACRNKKEKVEDNSEADNTNNEKPEASSPSNEDDSRFMPSSTDESIEQGKASYFVNTEDQSRTIEQEKIVAEQEESPECETEMCNHSMPKPDITDEAEPLVGAQSKVIYCRYCGGVVDDPTYKFCRHCGKTL